NAPGHGGQLPDPVADAGRRRRGSDKACRLLSAERSGRHRRPAPLLRPGHRPVLLRGARLHRRRPGRNLRVRRGEAVGPERRPGLSLATMTGNQRQATVSGLALCTHQDPIGKNSGPMLTTSFIDTAPYDAPGIVPQPGTDTPLLDVLSDTRLHQTVALGGIL